MFVPDFKRAVQSSSAIFTAVFPCSHVALEEIALKPDCRLFTVDDRRDLDLLQPVNFLKARNQGIKLCCGKTDSIQFELAAGDLQFKVFSLNAALDMHNAVKRFGARDQSGQVFR